MTSKNWLIFRAFKPLNSSKDYKNSKLNQRQLYFIPITGTVSRKKPTSLETFPNVLYKMVLNNYKSILVCNDNERQVRIFSVAIKKKKKQENIKGVCGFIRGKKKKKFFEKKKSDAFVTATTQKRKKCACYTRKKKCGSGKQFNFCQ